MKFNLILFILILHGDLFSQTINYQCVCSDIGIDQQWADSNKVTCYFIPVVRDVINKSSGNFHLAVVVTPSLRKAKEKPLLYLHGGPGIATLENVPRYLNLKTWKKLRQNRQLIFFDYRGTGFSEPFLCPDIQDSLAMLATKNLPPEETQKHKTDLYRKCRMQLTSDDIDVSTFNSFQLAKDAEAIRSALQIDKWNIYGVSYGTTVALNLLRNHGDHVSAMILDSPFPPNAPWLDFVRPFDASFKVLEKKIAEDGEVFSKFPSVRNDFVKAVIRLNETPVKIIFTDSTRQSFSGDDFAWSIWTALLKPSAIPLVPLVIHDVASGNDSFLSEWVTAFSNPDAFGKYSEFQSNAILCYEAQPRTEDDTRSALLAKYPDFTSFNIDFDGDLCNAWQPESAGNHFFEPVVSDVPVLILSGEYDPVCPPIFGQITSQTLPASTFVVIPAASHGAIHTDDCVRNIATDFLLRPSKKLSLTCIDKRQKINFVTDNLIEALSGLSKN